MSNDNVNDGEEAAAGTSTNVMIEPEGAIMSRAAVLLIIDLYKQRAAKFADKKTMKKKLWEEICKEMLQMGYLFTWQQIKTKYNNLLHKYKVTKDHNNKTGRQPKTCPYYNELDEYLSEKQNIRPYHTNDSLARDNLEENEESDNSVEQPPVPAKRQRVNSPKKSKVVKLLESMQARREIENERALAELKRQHEENMKNEKEKLEILKKFLEKL
ncbi:PREDICTED: trihelix transcription factor GT-2-like [Priapulus caudatus]|uniref:Trihelix transcription factor GT-2-like n=1 Tax=Priapulus caudatus TaxID=37621 RepID=A0ABM1ESV3_PRICU|nr:PREDICTED: trihelix transcription factor GT-2-like [Priapulus caudatus]